MFYQALKRLHGTKEVRSPRSHVSAKGKEGTGENPMPSVGRSLLLKRDKQLGQV